MLVSVVPSTTNSAGNATGSDSSVVAVVSVGPSLLVMLVVFRCCWPPTSSSSFVLVVDERSAAVKLFRPPTATDPGIRVASRAFPLRNSVSGTCSGDDDESSLSFPDDSRGDDINFVDSLPIRDGRLRRPR